MPGYEYKVDANGPCVEEVPCKTPIWILRTVYKYFSYNFAAKHQIVPLTPSYKPVYKISWSEI